MKENERENQRERERESDRERERESEGEWVLGGRVSSRFQSRAIDRPIRYIDTQQKQLRERGRERERERETCYYHYLSHSRSVSTRSLANVGVIEKRMVLIALLSPAASPDSLVYGWSKRAMKAGSPNQFTALITPSLMANAETGMIVFGSWMVGR